MQMSLIKYSIIIPFFNSEQTLKNCLDSILAEKYMNFEIILINDGSEDLSHKIALDYANNYDNIILINKSNGGVSSARNEGIKAARGDYILFVDSDDLILPGYFLTLDKAEESDYLVFGYIDNCGTNNILKLPLQKSCAEEYLLKCNNVSVFNKRYKRSILNNNSIFYKNNLFICEDFVFNFEYSLHCESMSTINEVIYKYNNFCNGSLTRKNRDDYIEQPLLAFDYCFKTFNDSKFDEKTRAEIQSMLDYKYCRTAFGCALQPVKHKMKCKKAEYVQITNKFSNRLQANIKPQGLEHMIMRFVIKYKIKSVLFIIAVIKNFIIKFKSR